MKAPIGSLFKQVTFRDQQYLAAIRRLPCLACGRAPCEAAHVRMTSAAHGKPKCGIGEKPSDNWTLPLCHTHHMRQHQVGEKNFWRDLRLDALAICIEFYAAYGVDGSMLMIANKYRRG